MSDIREAAKLAKDALEETQKLLNILYANTDRCHMWRAEMEERHRLNWNALEALRAALSDNGWREKADFFWDTEDPERLYQSPEDWFAETGLHEPDNGETVTIERTFQRAIHLPDMTYRITATKAADTDDVEVNAVPLPQPPEGK